MSFYPQRRRGRGAIVTAAVMGILLGALAGALLGRASAPSLGDRVADVREDAASVATRLSVLETEYPQGVREGRIVGRVEYEGARARAEAAANALERIAPDLGTLDPRGLRQARAALAALRRAIEARAPNAEIAAGVARVRAILKPPATSD